MAYEHILLGREDGVGVVTLNRPDKLNAMNRKLSSELRDAVKGFDADDAIGCILITGAGRAFSAGGDIHEQREDDRRFAQEELDARRGRGSYEIAASVKPTIGMINGLAYGGAAVLASSLDMRVGCEDTRFRFLAAAYGRINSTWTLPNQVGWPIAKELLFTARVVEAEEAHRIGLLNHLVPRDQLRAMRARDASADLSHAADDLGGAKVLFDFLGVARPRLGGRRRVRHRRRLRQAVNGERERARNSEDPERASSHGFTALAEVGAKVYANPEVGGGRPEVGGFARRSG